VEVCDFLPVIHAIRYSIEILQDRLIELKEQGQVQVVAIGQFEPEQHT
jgi:hypothetical protein